MVTLIRYAFRVAPGATVLAFAAAVAGAAMSVLLTLLIGRVVGAVPDVVAGRPDAMSDLAFSLLLAALLSVFVINNVLPTIRRVAQLAMTVWIRRDATVGVTEPLLRPTGIGHLEDKEIHDLQERAKGKAGFQIRIGMETAPELVSARLTMLGSAALVAQMFSVWVAIGLAAVTLGMEWHRAKVVGSEIDAWFGGSETQRQADYVFDLGLRDAPKEIRAFDLGGWMVSRFNQRFLDTWAPIWKARRRGLWKTGGMSAIHLGAHAFAIFLAGRAAMADQLPLTEVATTVPAILAIGASYNGYAAVQVKRANRAYRAMLELPEAIERRHPEPAVAASARPASGLPRGVIRFEDVGFRYPGTDVDVLDGLNLELRVGEALALVGINGAGKSTLVKLLAGTYEPTKGRITVDGVDLREINRPEWQRRVASIVQDFVRFPLPATDNIVLGAIEQEPNEAAVRHVAEQAGIARVIDRLADGWDTVLDKTYDGGVDLSGGEWQRLALARALFAVRAGASVLVLDEPAAALDVRSEADLVERYLDLTSGVTSLIISHRFSVVRDAHRICVLDGGRITETGTHAELIALSGKYAQMFTLQAERYRTEVLAPDQANGAEEPVE